MNPTARIVRSAFVALTAAAVAAALEPCDGFCAELEEADTAIPSALDASGPDETHTATVSVAQVLVPIAEGVQPPLTITAGVRPGDELRPGLPFRPSVTFGAELIGGLSYDLEDSFSEFEVYRAELGTLIRPTRWSGAEVRIEAIRSAVGRSLLGIDGNSLVLRTRRAYGWGHGWIGRVHVEGRLGLIPDPWVESIETHYDFRGLSPLLGESGIFFDAADAGVGLVVRGPSDWLGGDAVRLSVAMTNGEGRNESERNTGKNLTAVLSFQPIVATIACEALRVGVHGAWREGSTGFGSARSHRTAVGLTAQHPLAELGVEWITAHGYLGDGSIRAQGVGSWLGGQIVRGWLGAVGRADFIDPNTAIDDVDRRLLSFALFTDLGQSALNEDTSVFGRVRIHAGVQSVRASEDAGPIPGAPDAAQQTRVLLWVGSRGGGVLR
jgi:hypothetical protein